MAFADVLGRDPLELWLLAGLAVVILAALTRTVLQRRILNARSRDQEPLLVFPEDAMRRPMTPASIPQPAWGPREAQQPDPQQSQTGAGSEQPVQGAEGPQLPGRSAEPPSAERYAAPIRPVPTQGWQSEPTLEPADGSSWTIPPPRPEPGVVDEASETIRIPTADDGTVQLLPGRLVMTEGPEVGREYRFLRIAGQPVPQVTIGRASGPPYRHIQLAAATVSRLHARIRYENGSWHVANLSTTNPVRLNGSELALTLESPLSDGDRLQLGEVELSYLDGRT